MFESDAIVYICTYYDSANRTENIYCRHCSGLLLPLCINVTFGDTKYSLIPFVCVLPDICICVYTANTIKVDINNSQMANVQYA